MPERMLEYMTDSNARKNVRRYARYICQKKMSKNMPDTCAEKKQKICQVHMPERMPDDMPDDMALVSRLHQSCHLPLFPARKSCQKMPEYMPNKMHKECQNIEYMSNKLLWWGSLEVRVSIFSVRFCISIRAP